MRINAFILARGGSERLPQKNIMPLKGKPLIAYTIEAALACSEFDRVIVSTDCKEIAQIALFYGAEVPFIRSPALAQAQSTSYEALYDALYRTQTLESDVTVLMQPTSPLRSSQEVRQCIEAASAVTTFKGKPTGGVYALKTHEFVTTKSFMPLGVNHIEVSSASALDIDTIEDFQKAESLLA